MPEPAGIFSRIRIKVFVGFSVVLMAVIIAAIINFVALNRMSSSLSVLSEPDEKINCVRVLLRHLSNEETSARYYSFTGDSQYLALYHRLTDSVHYQLAQLKVLILDNDEQMELADSISMLAAQREAILNDFIENRQKALNMQAHKVSVGMKKQKMNKVQLPPLPPLSSEEGSSMIAADSSQHVTAAGKEEGKGFFSFNWVKDIFGSREKKAKKNETPVNANENITTVDSSSLTARIDSMTKPSFIQQQDKMEENDVASMQEMESWSSDELMLLQQNKEMMDRIRERVTMLEKDESAIKEQHAVEAKQKAVNATEMIGVISILGLIGTLVFITLIFRDISNSNRLRSQLENERKRAEKLAKVKEEFLANMSHEIRTPLNSIIGYSGLLTKDLNQKTKEDFVAAIQKSSSHLLSLVNQILDFSKLEAGKMQPEEVIFNFQELLREVYETFRLQALEKHLELSFQADEKIPVALHGDAMSMKQILINLVSNAIKFTGSGSVTIRAELEKEKANSCRIKTEIRDSGIGIPADAQEKIFSAFTQSNSEITRKFGGTGLGLAITKKLAQSLGGTIEVKSEEGQGSVFTVSVPFSKAKSVSPKSESDSASANNGKSLLEGKSVLIVDDEEMNVKLCKVILENWGLKTDAAYDGKEALEKLRGKNYDLVLLDIQMPEMSGIEVVKAIRHSKDEQKRELPVIALTANVFGNNNDEFISAGFSGELIKPFREQQLYEELEKHLLRKDQEKNTVAEGLESPVKSMKPYSLKYLEKTSGADTQFIESMLQSFVQNNTVHLQLFRAALEKNDYEAIHNLAHKMIPSFRYLEMKKMESKLRQLELLTKNHEPSDVTKPLVEEIISETEALVPMLNEEITKLQNENQVLSSTHTT